MGVGAIVGAGAMVTKDIPAWALMARVSARIMGDVRSCDGSPNSKQRRLPCVSPPHEGHDVPAVPLARMGERPYPAADWDPELGLSRVRPTAFGRSPYQPGWTEEGIGEKAGT
jgi:hypothetical protein